MKCYFFLFKFLMVSIFADAQDIHSIPAVLPPDEYENIHLEELSSDSLVSSFLIFVKKEVKAHKHLGHSEHVYVLEGEGELLLGETVQIIKAGDLVFIPKNTVHSLKVTSETSMKVISIQAPFFDGSDRVLLESK